ncbi:radical SAM protein, partial [bacterium]|nr:radical SAM protein [bacterium]
MKRPAILLVNPYLYDFAAYDLWIKPLGLLYLGAVLGENGCDVTLLDALDRHHPDVLALQNRTHAKSKQYGDGYFFKETVEKPREFSDV